MDAATQARLTARIRTLRRAGTTDLAAATYRVPAADYTSTAVLDAELDHLFARTPLLAGLSGDARTPGDWFTFEACGRSTIVWRGPDGALRAFVNACRHRGMQIVSGSGHAPRLLVCPYHAWSYGPDGALRAIPGDEGFTGLARNDIGLASLRVREQAGLVFVGGSEDTDPCDGVESELASFALGSYHQVERRTHRLALNWKLAVDSFMEAYHLHVLHKDTLRPIFHGNLSAFDAFGRHCRIVGVRRTFDGIDDDGGTPDLLPHVTLLYQLFPNAVLIHQQDHVELYQSFPDSRDPHAAEVRVTLYAPAAPANDAERAHWRKNLDLIDGVTTSEDFAACAAIQANLRVGAVPFLILGRNEPGVAHFHRMLHAVVGRADAAVPG